MGCGAKKVNITFSLKMNLCLFTLVVRIGKSPTLDEMRQVLKDTKYVTVALCMDNEPYLVSLSHGYDQTKNCLYFHCAPEGKKLIYAKANPNVWGQAVLDFGVTEECDYAYTSVQFSGKLCLITDLTEKEHAMEVLVRQVSLNPEEKLCQNQT